MKNYTVAAFVFATFNVVVLGGVFLSNMGIAYGLSPTDLINNIIANNSVTSTDYRTTDASGTQYFVSYDTIVDHFELTLKAKGLSPRKLVIEKNTTTGAITVVFFDSDGKRTLDPTADLLNDAPVLTFLKNLVAALKGISGVVAVEAILAEVEKVIAPPKAVCPSYNVEIAIQLMKNAFPGFYKMVPEGGDPLVDDTCERFNSDGTETTPSTSEGIFAEPCPTSKVVADETIGTPMDGGFSIFELRDGRFTRCINIPVVDASACLKAIRDNCP